MWTCAWGWMCAAAGGPPRCGGGGGRKPTARKAKGGAAVAAGRADGGIAEAAEVDAERKRSGVGENAMGEAAAVGDVDAVDRERACRSARKGGM